ncbi:MAG: Sec-independent protein translocase protein TatB [Alphaproteobacteria bacterium]|nr:Sec-independent protein translocase protein TatB [Alphaproteobacteria bacterium]MBU0832862.1 Sec-independent protein translocase protein TatB [Alphaproteobacteria bacterium]MBU1763839.1 Sec-independent protein translocase protein TatB [Alphaproteobacteria bacterium]
MLDIGWTELLVIAVILIVVVGPKDLPPMIRAFGKMTKRLRQTAGEFRAQFDEALREAELDDLKNSVNDIRSLNPANTIRETLNPLRQMGQEIKSDLERSTRLYPKSAPLDNGYEDNSILPEMPLGLGEPPEELKPVVQQPVAPAAVAQPASPAPAATAAPAPAAAAAAPAVAATAPATSAPAATPVVAKKTAARKPAAKAPVAIKAPAKSTKTVPVAVEANPAAKTAKPKPATVGAASAKAKAAPAPEPTAKPAPKARKSKSEDRA